ncbi:MAG: hypothetical protein B6U97_02365 [Candidatus Altiarchaeales archaeon ex4484_96]|nr:MAG: hypothetical protein B6U97_02365 [Candidatus Altiarchaeales archaeon ex4484_96]
MKKGLIALIGIFLLSTTNSALYHDYITLEWRYLAKGGNVDMLVYDFDGDGFSEIQAGFYNDGFGYLINHTGGMIWNIQTVVGVEAVHSDDIDGDGIPELMFGGGRTIYIMNPQGNLSFKYITQNNIRSITSGDYDNDGFNDILLASQSIRTSDLIVLDREARVLWQESVGGTHPPDFIISDYNLDGSSEVIVAAGKSVKMYDNQGVTLWNYKVDGEATDLEVADLNGDGVDDYVVSSTSSVYALDNGGNLLWVYDTACVSEAVCVSDLDCDGVPEVAVGAYEKVILLDNEGKLLWENDAVRQVNDVTTGDLDLDGNLEVIAGSDIVVVYDCLGNTQWEYQPYMRVNQLRVADLEDDGVNDLLVGGLDNTIYLFKPRMVYLMRDKSGMLCSDAEQLYGAAEYDKAMECIREAIDIRDSYGVGECADNPNRCDTLYSKISEKVTPATSSSTSTSTTLSSSSTTSSTSQTTTTTEPAPPEENNNSLYMIIGGLVLGVALLLAVMKFISPGKGDE